VGGVIYFILGFLSAVLTYPLWGHPVARIAYRLEDRMIFLCWLGRHDPEWYTSPVPVTEVECRRCGRVLRVVNGKVLRE
jgi:hypothetical protein